MVATASKNAENDQFQPIICYDHLSDKKFLFV